MSAPRPRTSPNFAFLARYDRFLVRAAGYAELYCHTDPNTTYFKLRQFIERLAALIGARFGLNANLKLKPLIDQLAARGIANPDVAQKLHYLREIGNEAVHEGAEDPARVVHAIKTARVIGAWFHRTVGETRFQLPPFVEPRPPQGADDTLRALLDQIGQLKDELTGLRDQAADAEERAAFEAELRRAAEAEAQARQGDVDAALALAEETAAENERHKARIEELQADAENDSDDEREALYQRALEAASVADPDEADTRYQIDLKLRRAGWEADSANLRYADGARPQKGRNLAIASATCSAISTKKCGGKRHDPGPLSRRPPHPLRNHNGAQ